MKIIKKRLQKIVGKFLYYARAIEPTMLMALNPLAAVQKNPKIEPAKKKIIFKLQRDIPRLRNRIQKKRNDYTHIFRCIIHIRTRGTKHIRWVFFPGQKSNTTIKEITPENGPMHVKYSIMINIMAPSTEVEL